MKRGKPFSFCIPDSLQCLLHQIDQMAGGTGFLVSESFLMGTICIRKLSSLRS